MRRALVAQQRRIARQGAIVMVGRDIGTVVLPEADLKVYLVAEVEERARRQYREVVQRRTGELPIELTEHDSEYESILGTLARRDRIDSSRDVAPLRAADDAVIIDTTDLTIEQVLERILELVLAA